MSETENLNDLLALTAEIVTAHVANNKVAPAELPTLIQSIYASLAATSAPAHTQPEKQEPAVPIRSSVKPDYIVCLEDGAKLKMLRRYLQTRFGMTPDEYRRKWGLPRDYPMVAPNYSAQRQELAKAIGLGRKKLDQAMAEPSAVAPAKAKRAVKSGAEAPKAARARTSKGGAPT